MTDLPHTSGATRSSDNELSRVRGWHACGTAATYPVRPPPRRRDSRPEPPAVRWPAITGVTIERRLDGASVRRRAPTRRVAGDRPNSHRPTTSSGAAGACARRADERVPTSRHHRRSRETSSGRAVRALRAGVRCGTFGSGGVVGESLVEARGGDGYFRGRRARLRRVEGARWVMSSTGVRPSLCPGPVGRVPMNRPSDAGRAERPARTPGLRGLRPCSVLDPPTTQRSWTRIG